MADPKKGTGKKPKGSGRRLYTDENPKDTVSIKFATPADARKTVAKVKRISKPFARKIQILTVGEQHAKSWVNQKLLPYLKKVSRPSEMLDKLVYKFFEGIDNFCIKIDSIYHEGHKKIRSFFKSKRKRK